MGAKLEKFHFTRGPGSGYPWDEWTDGDTWVIVQGVDYERNTDKMRESLYGRAKDLDGTRVRTQIGEVVLDGKGEIIEDDDGQPWVDPPKSVKGERREAIVFEFYAAEDTDG